MAETLKRICVEICDDDEIQEGSLALNIHESESGEIIGENASEDLQTHQEQTCTDTENTLTNAIDLLKIPTSQESGKLNSNSISTEFSSCQPFAPTTLTPIAEEILVEK